MAVYTPLPCGHTVIHGAREPAPNCKQCALAPAVAINKISLLEAAKDLLDARERLGPAAMERHDLWRCLAAIVADAQS